MNGDDFVAPKSQTFGGKLTIADLKDVMEAVALIDCSKWKHFGLQLGVFPPVLDHIEASHPGNPKDSLFETMQEFLKGVDPVPTWEGLANALRSRSVGEDSVAEEVERNHCISKTSERCQAALSAMSPGDFVSSTSKETSVAMRPKEVRMVMTGRETSESSNVASPSSLCSTSEKHFPFLKTPELSDQARQNLEGRLFQESLDMDILFTSFMLDTMESLKMKCVTPKDLFNTLTFLKSPAVQLKDSESTFAQCKKEIVKAESLQDAFNALAPFVSFFNFEIVELVIQHNGAQNDKSNLQAYKAKFELFCRRRICECPSELFEKSPGNNQIVVKIDDNFEEYTANALKLFRNKLCNIFGISEHELRVISISEGCVEIAFTFADYLEEKVFPLSDALKQSLCEAGVLKVTTKNHCYDLRSSDANELTVLTENKTVNFDQNIRDENDHISLSKLLVKKWKTFRKKIKKLRVNMRTRRTKNPSQSDDPESHYEEFPAECFEAAPNPLCRQYGIPFDETNQKAVYAELPFYNADDISVMGISYPEGVYGGSQISGRSSHSGGYMPIPGLTRPNINVVPSGSRRTKNPPQSDDPESYYEEFPSECFEATPNPLCRQYGIPFDETSQKAVYAELPFYNADDISGMGISYPEGVYGGSQISGCSSHSGGYMPIPGLTRPNINVVPSGSMTNVQDPHYTTMFPVGAEGYINGEEDQHAVDPREASQLNTPAVVKSPFVTQPLLGIGETECGLLDVGIKKPPYLREISISDDNIPVLCVNDCPLTPSPLKAEYRVLGSPMKPQTSRPVTKSPLQTIQKQTTNIESNTSFRSGSPTLHSDDTSDMDRAPKVASHRRKHLQHYPTVTESGYDSLDTESEAPMSAGNSAKLQRKSRKGSAGFEYPSTYMEYGGVRMQMRELPHLNYFERHVNSSGSVSSLAQAYQLGSGGKVSPRRSTGSHISLSDNTQTETLV